MSVSPLMPDPIPFAQRWIALWNSRDLDGVLRLYDDNIRFTSTTAEQLSPESHGSIQGKSALRKYWSAALAENPSLKFTLIGVFAGIQTIAIHYRNQLGAELCEVVTFANGRIVLGFATRRQQAELSKSD